MNGDNKRRIDNARDALVGILPDPKGLCAKIGSKIAAKIAKLRETKIMKFFTYVIRKMKNFLPRKEIESSILEEICEAANPPVSTYMKFLRKYFEENRIEKLATSQNLYLKDPFNCCKEMRNQIEQHESKETAELFEKIFLQCIQNATILIKNNHLENNIIFDEHDDNIIIIKNLDIAGEISLEFNRFIQVSFIRNVFRRDTVIKIRDSESSQGGFSKNQASNNLEIIFYNVSHILSSKNKYRAKVVFNYSPHAFGLAHNAPLGFQTTIDFADNKIFDLSIDDHFGIKKWDRESIPIKHISFFEGNKIEYIDIQTASNKMPGKSLSEPSADIESIFFDTRENIGLSDEKGSPSFRFIEIFFRDLKKQAVKREDRLLENTYNRQEKIFLMDRLYRIEDKLILWWGAIASDTGTSWKKPLGLLLFAQFLLALTAYCLFAGYDPSLDKMCPPDLEECNPYLDTGFTPFFGLLAWFMNPVSLLPSAKITMASWFIYVLFFCQKLFSVVFYYEIVTVLRRFSKKTL